MLGFAGLFLGEATLVFWTASASRQPAPTASAYLEQPEYGRKVFWLKYENRFGISYVPVIFHVDEVVAILGTEFNAPDAVSSDFLKVQKMLADNVGIIHFVQVVKFLDIELGAWYCYMDSKGNERQHGAIPFGEQKSFLITPKSKQYITQGPSECHSSWKFLTNITVGRCLWDLAHIILFVVLWGCVVSIIPRNKQQHSS